jgi:hypothetical protein
MDKERLTDLTAGVRVCRVCGVSFIGHGALCAEHQAEQQARQAAEVAAANARMEMRIKAQRQARRARARTEWVEAV